jgi:thioredoxin 1
MKKSKMLTLGLVLLILVFAGAYNVYETSGGPAENELNEALKSGKPVLLYFYSATCASCKEQSKILDAMESEHGDRVMFVRVDASGNWGLLREYEGIFASFPVIVIFDSESTVVERYAGVTEQDELERALALD